MPEILVMPVSPSDEQLSPVIQSLRESNPALGLSKFHSLLLSQNLEWSVSEKRIKKVLIELGLWSTNSNNGSTNGSNLRAYPKSSLNQNLKIENWTCKSPFLKLLDLI
jgi:hypothetical protein